MDNLTLVLLSAGESSRFNCRTKKQWLRVDGSPLWLKVLKQFQNMKFFSKIIITAHKEEVSLFQKYTDVEVIQGGNSRQNSILNALQNVTSEFVVISDIARCFIPKKLVSQLLESRFLGDVVVPYLSVSDTVVVGNESVNRDEVKLIQTPQISKTEFLIKSLKTTSEEFSDESSLIVANGGTRYFVRGDSRAKKLTYSTDIQNSVCFESGFSEQIFVGNGFDVHQFGFEKDRKLVLGGVEIESELSFKAHSDGDVLIHSLIDSILGGAGIGDIGELFPDNNNQYKNIDSKKLLQIVHELIEKIGLEISNIDLTIIAEAPKLGKYKDLIRKELSKMLKIPLYTINIKATTTEKLGFVGRKEGVAVLSTATLKSIDWRKIN
jgi:2-C-methyl-D-erythritol 4-phosphate cytidylyltransferase/2-C-methyl-D-erythritol 2,4-cyclodiphosphate synthase